MIKSKWNSREFEVSVVFFVDSELLKINTNISS